MCNFLWPTDSQVFERFQRSRTSAPVNIWFFSLFWWTQNRSGTVTDWCTRSQFVVQKADLELWRFHFRIPQTGCTKPNSLHLKPKHILVISFWSRQHISPPGVGISVTWSRQCFWKRKSSNFTMWQLHCTQSWRKKEKMGLLPLSSHLTHYSYASFNARLTCTQLVR